MARKLSVILMRLWTDNSVSQPRANGSPDELSFKVPAPWSERPAGTVTQERSCRSLGGRPRQTVYDFGPVWFPDVNLRRASPDREEDHGTGSRPTKSRNALPHTRRGGLRLFRFIRSRPLFGQQ